MGIPKEKGNPKVQVHSGPLFPDHYVKGRNTCSFLEEYDDSLGIEWPGPALAVERVDYTTGHSGPLSIRIESDVNVGCPTLPRQPLLECGHGIDLL